MSPETSPDTEVRRSLHAAAGRVAVPPTDVEGLRAAGRRHARRRTTVTALTSAAMLAVLVGTGAVVTQGDSGRTGPGPTERTEEPDRSSKPAVRTQPISIEDLPYGEPAGVPAARGGVLYTPGMFTDMEERGRIRELALNGGVALGVHTQRGIVRVNPDGHFVDLGASGHDIAVSSHGGWAAWLIAGDGQGRAMLWDLRHDEAEEVRALPLRGSCCDDPVQLLGVDNAGRVFVSSGSEGGFVWDHRADAVERIHLPEGDAISQVVVDDVVVRSPAVEKGALPRYTLGRVDEAGRFVGEQQVSGHDVLWAPDLSRPARVVQPGSGPVQVDGDRLEVLDPSSGDWQPMLVPSEVSLGGYLWKNGHLLVTVYDSKDGYNWLRCSALSGACERAIGIGPAGGWVLPER